MQRRSNKLTSKNQSDIFSYIVNAIHRITSLPVSIWIPRDDGKALVIAAAIGLPESYIQSAFLDLRKPSVTVDAFRSNKIRKVMDIASDTRWKYKEQAREMNWKSAICVPIKADNFVIGVISVYAYTERSISELTNILPDFAKQIALTLEVAKQKEVLQQILDIDVKLQSMAETPKNVLNSIVKVACEITGAGCAVTYPFDAEHDEFYDIENVATYGLFKPLKLKEKPRSKGGMASYIKRRGEVVLTDLEEQDPEMHMTSSFIRREKIQAFMGIALRVGREVLGILYVNFRSPHEFTKQQKNTIRLFSHQASNALYNARLYQRANSQIDALERLHEVGSTLTSIPKKPENLRIFLTRIVESAQQILGADLVDLYQYFQDQDQYDLPPIQIGERYEEFVIKDMIYKDDVIWKIVQARKPKYTSDAQQSKILTSPFTVKHRKGPDNRFVIREGLKSTAAIPLMAGDEILGVLFANYRSRQSFNNQQKKLIELFASQAAIAIWNSRSFTSMQKRLEERLNDISVFQQIHENLYSANSQEIFSLIAEKAAQLTNGKYGGLWLLDKTGTQLVLGGLSRVQIPTHNISWIPIDPKSINGWVVKTKRPYLCNDVTKDAHYKEWYADTRSELAVPLLYSGNVIGTLNVESTAPNNFTDDHVELLKTLANQAAIAVQNAKTIRKLDTLDEVGQALTSTIRLRERDIVELIYKEASALMDTDNMYIALYDERTDIVRFGLVYVNGKRIDIEKNKSYQTRKAGQGKTEEIIRTREPILHSTLEETKAWYRQSGRKEYIGVLFPSWIGVPMVVDDKVIGVIATYQKRECTYTPDDLDILQSMAAQAAIAIDNARMFYDVNQRLTALVAFEQEVTSVIHLGEERILELIYQQVSQLMNTQNFYIALYNGSTNTIRFGLAFKDGKRTEWQSRKAGKGKTEVILSTKKPLFHATYTESKAWYSMPEHQEYVGDISSSWMGVPMIVRDNPIGVIGTYHLNKEYLYDGNDLEFLQAMANQAAIALDNARLYQEARGEAIAAKQLATLGTAIAALQHRINNTLNIIIPNITRLRSRINVNDATIKEILDIIERNTRYTSDILMRIQTPLQEVESNHVNLNSILTEVAEAARKEWDKKSTRARVRVKLDLEESIPLIQLPVGQISEIVRNLIDNSYRAMKKDGGKLTIISRMEQDQVCIRLQDTAKGGIPPAIQQRLFQKPVPSKEPGQGAGLGLWLSKLMLQGMGGDVTIQETGSTGTTMLLQIPVSESRKEATL